MNLSKKEQRQIRMLIRRLRKQGEQYPYPRKGRDSLRDFAPEGASPTTTGADDGRIDDEGEDG